MKPVRKNFAISMNQAALDGDSQEKILNRLYELLVNEGLGSTYAADPDGCGRYDFCFYLKDPDKDMDQVEKFCADFDRSYDPRIIHIQ